MEEEVYLYKFSHYHSINDAESSVFVFSSIEVEDMVKVLGAISFKFEELVTERVCMEEKHIVRILEKFYGVTDATDGSEFLHSFTELEKSEWNLVNIFNVHIEGKELMSIIHIDLFGARESCGGNEYDELMDKYLPKTKEFEDEIKNLADDYPYLTK